MAKFIDTYSSEWIINLDHVARIRRHRDPNTGADTADLLDRNGETLGTVHGRVEADRFTGGLVTAPPGYTVVTFEYDEERKKGHISEEPIIAFEVGGSAAIPFTLDGTPSDSNTWAIKRPDGVVVDTNDRDWDNVDAYCDGQLARVGGNLTR
jgi:hypothetical protein